MTCPACQVMLQPLPPTSTWVPAAIQHASHNVGVAIPAQGPAALTWLALIAHAMVIHPDLPLTDYLEAYLAQ